MANKNGMNCLRLELIECNIRLSWICIIILKMKLKLWFRRFKGNNVVKTHIKYSTKNSVGYVAYQANHIMNGDVNILVTDNLLQSCFKAAEYHTQLINFGKFHLY